MICIIWFNIKNIRYLCQFKNIDDLLLSDGHKNMSTLIKIVRIDGRNTPFLVDV